MAFREARSRVGEPPDERTGADGGLGVHDADRDRAHGPESSRSRRGVRGRPNRARLHRPRREFGRHRGDSRLRRSSRSAGCPTSGSEPSPAVCDAAGRDHGSGRVPQRGRSARRPGGTRSGDRALSMSSEQLKALERRFRSSAAAPLGTARARSRSAHLRSRPGSRSNAATARGRSMPCRPIQGTAAPRGPTPGRGDRLFVLAPLADIAPGLVPPGWGCTVETARREAARARRRRCRAPASARGTPPSGLDPRSRSSAEVARRQRSVSMAPPSGARSTRYAARRGTRCDDLDEVRAAEDERRPRRRRHTRRPGRRAATSPW